MACMGPNLEAYRLECESVLNKLNEQWVRAPIGGLRIRCINKFPNLKLVHALDIADWIAAFYCAKPDGTFEEFKFYLYKMYEIRGCWDF